MPYLFRMGTTLDGVTTACLLFLFTCLVIPNFIKNRTQYYVFKEIPCDIGGRGFVVHRLGLANLYHVRVGAPTETTCECMGFLAHGNCKHAQGLAALIGHGLV